MSTGFQKSSYDGALEHNDRHIAVETRIFSAKGLGLADHLPCKHKDHNCLEDDPLKFDGLQSLVVLDQTVMLQLFNKVLITLIKIIKNILSVSNDFYIKRVAQSLVGIFNGFIGNIQDPALYANGGTLIDLEVHTALAHGQA